MYFYCDQICSTKFDRTSRSSLKHSILVSEKSRVQTSVRKLAALTEDFAESLHETQGLCLKLGYERLLSHPVRFIVY
jgi:hypothetical protein